MSIAYDYIIVGGGSAGCVIAGRLAEDNRLNILLLEAGEKVTHHKNISCPGLFGDLINSKFDWQFENYPRGKMLGGCSNINACIYIRADPASLDQWPKGWQSKDLIPYFIKAENCSHLPEEILELSKKNRGFNGPMKISLAGDNGKNINLYSKIFVQACKTLGFPYTPDINNGVFQDGVSYHQFNIYEGHRHSTEVAYLRDKENLTILCNEKIVKINIKNNNAINVESASGKIYKAKREIILSAGAICSPWLLMLSGIGEKKALAHLNIPCLSDLPVGKDFSDHVMTPFLFTTQKKGGIDPGSKKSLHQWKTTKTGDLSDSGIQASLFAKSQLAVDKNDIQISFLPGIPEQIHNFMTLVLHKNRPKTFSNRLFLNSPAFKKMPRSIRNLVRYFLNKMHLPQHGFVMLPVVGLPSAQGNLTLKSNRFSDFPSITYPHFASKQDEAIMLDAVKLIRRIAASEHFKTLGVKEMIDPSIPFDPKTDEYILHYTQASSSQGHIACTCSIGKVVDTQLKVIGINRLRVVDASVLPTMVNSNIQNTVIAIAEKAADLLKCENKT